MKKLLLFIVILPAASCVCTNPLVEPSTEVHNSAHKEYIRYVNSDENLTDFQKAIRKRNIENYGRLLDELRK